jgi:methyl-accepting chemotaxis protein
MFRPIRTLSTLLQKLNWSLRYKIGLAFALILLYFIGSGTISVLYLVNVRQTQALQNNTSIGLEHTQSYLQAYQTETQIYYDTIFVTRVNQIRANENAHDIFNDGINQTMLPQNQSGDDNSSEQQFVSDLSNIYYTAYTDFNHLTDLINKSEFEQAGEALHNYQPDFDKLKNLLTDHLNALQAQRTELANRQSQEIKEAIITTAVIAACSFLLAVFLLALFEQVLVRPLNSLERGLRKISTGDLTVSLHVANRDQIGAVAQAFNDSLNRLCQVISLLQKQVVRVNSAATEIATTSYQTTARANNQASAISEVGSTLAEMNATARQITNASQMVSRTAEDTLDSASSGQVTLNSIVSGINQVKLRVGEIAAKIIALNERTQKVGSVVAQINGIAEETHLLALNAAIESAESGVEGRRFGIVASKVKQLAERSRKATQEIQLVLKEIQMATAASVMATEQGLKEAEQGVDLVYQGKEAIENIIVQAERTVQLASAILMAMNEQDGATEQVVNAMSELANVVSEGVAIAQQNSSLAILLTEIAHHLKEQSSQFDTDKKPDIIVEAKPEPDEEILTPKVARPVELPVVAGVKPLRG